MSHLHVPDGVLPAWLWASGLALALLVIAWPAGASDARAARRAVATQGALGGLVLSAMAIPFGPLDVHLTLAGTVGVLLGARAGFQVGFVVSAILALMGHGGVTVVGLNALVFGVCAATARPAYAVLARRLGPAAAMAWATAAGQSIAGLAWLGVALAGLEAVPVANAHPHGARLAAIAVPLWALGVAVEALVAFGIGRFLARVAPSLLPGGLPAPPLAAVAEAP